MEQTTPQKPILAVSIEISNRKWLLTSSPLSEARRRAEVEAGDLAGLRKEVQASLCRFKLPTNTRVVFCYEAGRDGFWIARALKAAGYEVLMIDSASIEVNRRARRTKTDRIDGLKLLALLVRHIGGEKKVFNVVNIPTPEQEDLRRVHRERDRLTKERTGHTNRIGSLLALHGLRLKITPAFLNGLTHLRQWNDQPLPEHLQEEIKREYQRLLLINEQLRELQRGRRELLKKVHKEQRQKGKRGMSAVKPTRLEEQQALLVLGLLRLKGVGEVAAWKLVCEYFGWRQFKNRRQVGGLAGLTGTPYSSGDSTREQGISKVGRGDMRALVIELAWAWVRYQPKAKLTKQFLQHTIGQGKRGKRRAIVALARQLLVAMWRYLDYGEIPEGAELKTKLFKQTAA